MFLSAWRRHTQAALLGIAVLLSILVLLPSGSAETYPFDASLYDAATIRTLLTVGGGITLSGSGSASSLEANVAYVPEESDRLLANPKPATTDPLLFTWKDVGQGEYPFSYEASVTTHAAHPQVTSVAYPFNVPSQIAPALQPQMITDTNAQIRAEAMRLVAGENDSVRVVAKIALWVKHNVAYNLTSVTADASEPASWVYRERQGVCDELSSLFISMSREAGIPARFVSGIAYTNLPEFADHWGPHGWAEVWLPDIGWVPVDVTYGEILWLDATHIPIDRGLDAKSTAVEYSTRGRGISMQPRELVTDVRILYETPGAKEPITATLTPQYGRAGSQSGNAIIARIRNDGPNTIITEAYLIPTREVTLADARSVHILLPPHSTRSVTWRVTLPTLEPRYEYTFPFTVVLQRGDNASAEIVGTTHDTVYQLPPQTKLDTDTDVAGSFTIECTTPSTLYVGESTQVTCTSPGSTVCADTCVRNSANLLFTATEAGAFPRAVTAQNAGEKSSAIVTFVVTKRPRPAIEVNAPQSITPSESATIGFSVATEPVYNATITVHSTRIKHEWNASVLTSKDYALEFPGQLLDAGANTITISVTGQDKNGARVTVDRPIEMTLDATMWEKIELFVIHLLS